MVLICNDLQYLTYAALRGDRLVERAALRVDFGLAMAGGGAFFATGAFLAVRFPDRYGVVGLLQYFGGVGCCGRFMAIVIVRVATADA